MQSMSGQGMVGNATGQFIGCRVKVTALFMLRTRAVYALPAIESSFWVDPERQGLASIKTP